MTENQDHRKRSPEGAFLALTVWLLALGTVTYGLRSWFPPLASEHGVGVDRMMHYLMVASGFLFLTGHLVLGYVVWRFSRQGAVTVRILAPRLERRWSIILAVIMTLVAEGGVLVLGLPVWNRFHSKPPADAVTVEVTGEQFGWNVHYAGVDGMFGRSSPQMISLDNPVGIDRKDAAAKDDVLLLGTMYLPVNRPAHIRLRSKDVLHSFFLPNFRVKQDAVPGMTIDFWFVPTKPGTYEIACAELCGFAHYNMRGVLYVISESEFEQWLKSEAPFFS